MYSTYDVIIEARSDLCDLDAAQTVIPCNTHCVIANSCGRIRIVRVCCFIAEGLAVYIGTLILFNSSAIHNLKFYSAKVLYFVTDGLNTVFRAHGVGVALEDDCGKASFSVCVIDPAILFWGTCSVEEYLNVKTGTNWHHLTLLCSPVMKIANSAASMDVSYYDDLL
jgi:hypothetical protein